MQWTSGAQNIAKKRYKERTFCLGLVGTKIFSFVIPNFIKGLIVECSKWKLPPIQLNLYGI